MSPDQQQKKPHNNYIAKKRVFKELEVNKLFKSCTNQVKEQMSRDIFILSNCGKYTEQQTHEHHEKAENKQTNK